MYIGNAATGAVFNKDTVLQCSSIIILEFKFSCLVYVLGVSMRMFRRFGRKVQLVEYVEYVEYVDYVEYVKYVEYVADISLY